MKFYNTEMGNKKYKSAADKWCNITDSTNYCLFVSLTTKQRKIILLHKTGNVNLLLIVVSYIFDTKKCKSVRDAKYD